MNEKRVLVAYGTRYGSARIVARDIAEAFGQLGHRVDLADLRKDRVRERLDSYDLIVAGSSVAMFMWLGAVKRFLRRSRRSAVPTAVFICCGTAIDEAPKARERFLDRVIDKIGLEPVMAQPVPPVIDFRPEVGLSEGLKKRISGTIKAMAKDDFQPDGLMDFRNRDEFQEFLKRLTGLLAA